MAKKRAGNATAHTIAKLWAKAAGRCEYDGCNKLLYKDDLTSEEINRAFVAHIVAASPDGPRGDATMSAQLVDDIDNVMLLCHDHHRLIDHEQVAEHSVERLREMKKKHEDRIRMVTEIDAAKVSVPFVYGVNIGKEAVSIPRTELALAMLPDDYPSENTVLLSHRDSSIYDSMDMYWASEAAQLDQKYLECLKPLVGRDDIDCVSVFALAPQPLLVKLGTKLTDLHKVKVYQKHREPDTWKWQTLDEPNPMKIIHPHNKTKSPVLVFSLSTKAISRRVRKRYGDEASIWEVTAKNPGNDMLRSADQLEEFRKITRKVLDDINASSSEQSIKVFMAMPAACAVELGRVWMPKADKQLVLFDKNNAVNMNDTATITIKHV
jgi:hypothetical protein